MTHTIEKNKWSLRRHTRDFEKLCTVARAIKNYTKSSISNENKELLQNKLKEQGLYNERNPDMPLDAIDHKIRDLAFYMFGYRKKVNGAKKFLFSPLANLFLNYVDDKKKRQKIFFTMLWGMQFEHPESSTSHEFHIFPFRLIFTLLNEPRLGNKLFAYEIAKIIMFITSIESKRKYENLINELLNLRSMTHQEITVLFEQDSHTLVNAIYEWDYYSSNILGSSGVLKKTMGNTICKLQHGNSNTFRKVTKNYVELNPELKTLYEQLSSENNLFSSPLELNDPERMKSDVIKEIYSYYPHCLLVQIGEESKANNTIGELLELPKLIEQYSNNNNNEEAYVFEDVLESGFNMFINVDAKKIGGAGNTDLECLYDNDQKKKFSVDAKSTKNKLSSINSGRLTAHREKIGGAYTIVVTSRYVPAVKLDIRGSEIVILLASTFSEYLYNCINNDYRDIDYAPFDEIIESNLGKDVSENVSKLTFEQFASGSMN